jgi:hypothetical protein
MEPLAITDAGPRSMSLTATQESTPCATCERGCWWFASSTLQAGEGGSQYHSGQAADGNVAHGAVCSEDHQPDTCIRYLKEGADLYLSKPIVTKEVAQLWQHVVLRRERVFSAKPTRVRASCVRECRGREFHLFCIKPRDDGLAHPADTSRSNLEPGLGLLSRWRLLTLPHHVAQELVTARDHRDGNDLSRVPEQRSSDSSASAGSAGDAPVPPTSTDLSQVPVPPSFT